MEPDNELQHMTDHTLEYSFKTRKTASLPAAAVSQPPCEEEVDGIGPHDPVTYWDGIGPHDPVTCWWCQRGLTLVKCTQDGSHV